VCTASPPSEPVFQNLGSEFGEPAYPGASLNSHEGQLVEAELHDRTSTKNVICIGPQLGYDIPPEFARYLTYPPEVIQAVQGSLTLILVLHPICTALVFLSALSSLCLGSHAWSIIVLIISVIAGVIASVSLAIDIALVVTVRDYLAQIQGITLVVEFGNLVWMAVAGVILVWLAIMLLSARVCYCCGVG
jgi:SUR7/PalI family